MSKFANGDVVVLKSGGPSMTVEKSVKYAGNDFFHVHCSWFEKHNRFNDVFAEHMLDKAVTKNSNSNDFDEPLNVGVGNI
ncbi:YodC family protein [Providencia sp. Me1]|uniref:YodC family protein n=1 Tax=Providencia sp. Me1 TaxID=3392634 RepID=UPI003D2D0ABC